MSLLSKVLPDHHRPLPFSAALKLSRFLTTKPWTLARTVRHHEILLLTNNNPQCSLLSSSLSCLLYSFCKDRS